jgi:hypothetical protein
MFVEHQSTSGTKIYHQYTGTRALLPDYWSSEITVVNV